MKHIILFLTSFILFANVGKSQLTSHTIIGNYIGQSVKDLVVITIEVKKNHKYILKTYDSNKKLQKSTKGKWTLEGDKMILNKNSGLSIVLVKHNDIWYTSDKSGTLCLARFYQNKDPKEFWAELRQKGC